MPLLRYPFRVIEELKFEKRCHAKTRPDKSPLALNSNFPTSILSPTFFTWESTSSSFSPLLPQEIAFHAEAVLTCHAFLRRGRLLSRAFLLRGRLPLRVLLVLWGLDVVICPTVWRIFNVPLSVKTANYLSAVIYSQHKPCQRCHDIWSYFFFSTLSKEKLRARH